MKISVIIPTRNRKDILFDTLSALKKQSLGEDLFEVLIVDDGSSEEHRKILRDHVGKFNYTLLEKEHGGLAAARNLGADHADGDILYFLDDDVIPAPNTLAHHVKTHEIEKNIIAVIGSLPYPKSFKISTFLWYLDRRGHYDLYMNPKKYPGGTPPLPPLNGNSSLPRKVFFDLGKYDETFKQYGGEDLEFGYRLANAGIEFVYNPFAIGYHNHLKNFANFCIDMEKSGESLIMIYRKYPEIKQMKKIDIVEDGFFVLKGRKKIIKAILSITLICPWLLALPKSIIGFGESFFSSRYILYPLYHWVSQYYYAIGMKRELSNES